MSDQANAEAGTKPGTAEGTTPEAAPAAAPAPSAEPAAKPSEADARYEAAVREMNDKQRLAADERRAREDAERERDYYRHLAAEAAGLARRAADPVASAEAEYRQVLEQNPYNVAAIMVARDRLEAERTKASHERITEEAVRKALLASRVQNELPEAARLLGISDVNAATRYLEQIAREPMTPVELAYRALARNGKLADVVLAERDSAAQRARDATALKSLAAGGPSGRRVPGAADDGGTLDIHFAEWAALSDDARARLRAGKRDVVIYDAPKHYDPNKD